MATRTLHLISFRESSAQRAHFSIWVPSGEDPTVGTLIHVVGAPMAGFTLEFKRNYNPTNTRQHYTMIPIGEVYADNIVDSPPDAPDREDTPRDNLETIACQVPPPRASQNFLAPVNDTTNRRCQEWTTDYVRRLVDRNVLASTALDLVQSSRDPPTHGIGLSAAGRAGEGGRRPGREQRRAEAEASSAPVPLAQAADLESVWDERYQRYRRWDIGRQEWIWL